MLIHLGTGVSRLAQARCSMLMQRSAAARAQPTI
jgi:hypothetical protein